MFQVWRSVPSQNVPYPWSPDMLADPLSYSTPLCSIQTKNVVRVLGSPLGSRMTCIHASFIGYEVTDEANVRTVYTSTDEARGAWRQQVRWGGVPLPPFTLGFNMDHHFEQSWAKALQSQRGCGIVFSTEGSKYILIVSSVDVVTSSHDRLWGRVQLDWEPSQC